MKINKAGEKKMLHFLLNIFFPAKAVFCPEEWEALGRVAYEK